MGLGESGRLPAQAVARRRTRRAPGGWELDAPTGSPPGSILDRGMARDSPRTQVTDSEGFPVFKKEIHPRLPIAPGADAVEQVVVGGPVLFEVKAQVKQWLSEERNNCGSGSRVPMLSSRPTACVARSKSRCRSLESSNGGTGAAGEERKPSPLRLQPT